MKRFEMAEAGRYMINDLPVLARLDGRCFHTYTRGLARPYDTALQECMLEATKALVGEFHPEVGYTQSDEITLVWTEPLLFDGRFQKYCSVLSSLCTVVFNQQAAKLLPNKKAIATFDCRVWQVPSLVEAFNTLLWRERDAAKNSIQMAARGYYSHKELMGKSGSQMQEMLFQKGVNWNDYPPSFKRGTYVQRKTVEVPISPETMARIPVKHRPTGPAIRSEVQVVPVPKLSFAEENFKLLFPSTVEDPLEDARQAWAKNFDGRAALMRSLLERGDVEDPPTPQTSED